MNKKHLKSIIAANLSFISTIGLTLEIESNNSITEKPIHLSNELIAKQTSVYEKAQILLSNKSGANIVTVGPEASCTYQDGSIQGAINDGNNHIRVVAGTYIENPYFTNSNITLEGGYDDCMAAAADTVGNGVTIIDGSNDPEVSVITIDNSAISDQITLRRLTIKNGGQPSLLLGGGISISDSTADILLDTLDINNNSANYGGGIGIVNGSPTVIIKDTNIQFNTGQSGGGISCNSSGETYVTFYDTGSPFLGSILGNNATVRNGGGVELEGGCSMFFYSGQTPNQSDTRGLLLNNAKEHGGGVAVSGSSSFTAIGYESGFGNNQSPVTIRGNNADNDSNNSGNGGGVSVRDIDSQAFLVNVNIQDNTAYNGGAVSAEDGGEITTFSQLEDGTCWDPDQCNSFNLSLIHI